MASPTCETCRYWKHNPGYRPENMSQPGKCRIRSVAEWPVRMDDEWCGEHKPIQVDTASVDGPTTIANADGSVSEYYSEYEETQT